MSVSVISSMILYLSENPLMILLGRVLAGVTASGWVIFTILFSSYFDKSKAASRISYLSVFTGIGHTSSMLFGGLVAGYLGYKFPFIAGTAVATIGLIFSLFIKENVPEQGKPIKLKELLFVVKDKNLLVMSTLAIITQFIHFGATLTFVNLVADNLGASGEQLGFLSMVNNIPRILSALLCGFLLSRKINVKIMLATSYALLALNCALTPFSPNLPVLYAISTLSGFGNGISMTLCLSLCTLNIDDNRRSAAMGFFQAIYGIGMFVGPLVTGIISDSANMVWAFIFCAIVASSGIFGSIKYAKDCRAI
jgi:MFS family permease